MSEKRNRNWRNQRRGFTNSDDEFITLPIKEEKVEHIDFVDNELVPEYVIVNQGSIRLRDFPKPESTFTRRLYKGTRLKVLSVENSDWLRVRYNNSNDIIDGYVMSKFVDPLRS